MTVFFGRHLFGLEVSTSVILRRLGRLLPLCSLKSESRVLNPWGGVATGTEITDCSFESYIVNNQRDSCRTCVWLGLKTAGCGTMLLNVRTRNRNLLKGDTLRSEQHDAGDNPPLRQSRSLWKTTLGVTKAGHLRDYTTTLKRIPWVSQWP